MCSLGANQRGSGTRTAYCFQFLVGYHAPDALSVSTYVIKSGT
jgi:hypothetical protein